MALHVVSREVGDQTVVDVAGEIDVATADTLRERLNALIDRQRVDLVVDLREVGFMDSTGLGLLTMRERAELIGGRLEMSTTAPHGTTVTVTVPVTRGARIV